MDNLFYTLLTTLETLIKAHPNITASNVALGRHNALSETELPFVGIFLADDNSLGEFGATNTSIIDWQVQVDIELYVSGLADAAIDQTFLNLRADVHNAIMADPTLGVAFVLQSVPLGASSPVRETNELKTSSYALHWAFQVRTGIDDMTTIV